MRLRGLALALVAASLGTGAALAGTATSGESAVSAAVTAIGDFRGVREVLVWHHDEVVAHRSFRGGDPGAHDIKSASKSLLSALVGIGLQKGWIAGLDQPVSELLPEAFAVVHERDKERITVRHLLSMTTGLASTSGEHYGAWVSQRNWVLGALRRPVEQPPGEAFTYSTGNSHLLSAILTRATGESTLALAEEHLFGPLGLEVHGWERSPQGIYMGGNNFRTTAEDLLRFGRLYLNEGSWQGRQLVPAEWVRLSTRRHAGGWPDRYGAYGYLWWIPREAPESFLAVGYAGQFLYVVPGLDAAIVVLSSHDAKGAEWDRQLLRTIRERLMPALTRSREP